jgi:hypothetical protein
MAGKKVAFVSYNSIGRGLTNGWVEQNGNHALVLQNSKGDRLAAPLPSLEAPLVVCQEIRTLWGELREALPTLDHVFIYVGANGSEVAIKLSASLPGDKVTFVTCTCKRNFKEELIRASNSTARVVTCDCGGIDEMGMFYERFLETGSIDIP